MHILPYDVHADAKVMVVLSRKECRQFTLATAFTMTSVGMSGSSLFLMTSTRSFIRVTLYLTLDSTIFDGRSFNVLLVRDVVAIVVSRVVVVLDPRVGQFSTWKSDGKSTWLFWCRIERNISVVVRISARWQHVIKNVQRFLFDS